MKLCGFSFASPPSPRRALQSQPVAAAWSLKTELKLKKRKNPRDARAQVIFLIMENLKLQRVYMESPKSERRNEKTDNNRRARLLWCEQYCVCIYYGSLLLLLFFVIMRTPGMYSTRKKLSPMFHCYRGWSFGLRTRRLRGSSESYLRAQHRRHGTSTARPNQRSDPETSLETLICCSSIHVSRFISLLLALSLTYGVFLFTRIASSPREEEACFMLTGARLHCVRLQMGGERKRKRTEKIVYHVELD